jgi:hypothetical protein
MIGPDQSWIHTAEGGRDFMLRYPLIGYSCASAWSFESFWAITGTCGTKCLARLHYLNVFALPVISFCNPTSSSTCIVVPSLCTTLAMMKLRPSKRILSTTDLEPFTISSNRNVERENTNLRGAHPKVPQPSVQKTSNMVKPHPELVQRSD